MAEQVLEGVWEKIQQKLHSLPSFGRRVKVIVREVSATEPYHAVTPPSPKVLTFGMFPELSALTEEDFASAEFHMDNDDLALQ
jgi:hypothetical protein